MKNLLKGAWEKDHRWAVLPRITRKGDYKKIRTVQGGEKNLRIEEKEVGRGGGSELQPNR